MPKEELEAGSDDSGRVVGNPEVIRKHAPGNRSDGFRSCLTRSASSSVALAFLDVGGGWFLMWQSKMWNGQEEAFRMFTIVGVVLLIVVQREPTPD